MDVIRDEAVVGEDQEPKLRNLRQSPFFRSVERAAKHFMRTFFHRMADRHGGIINSQSLRFEEQFLTEENLDLVLSDLDQEEKIDQFYRILNHPPVDGDVITPDIRYYITAQLHCAKRGVPKTFAPGICCVHAKEIGRWPGIGTDIYWEGSGRNDGYLLNDGLAIFDRRIFGSSIAG